MYLTACVFLCGWQVTPNGVAARTGRLKTGDRILKVVSDTHVIRTLSLVITTLFPCVCSLTHD